MKMVRVGPRPHMYRETDRWNCETGTWGVSYWGWIPESRWKDIDAFQAPFLNGRLTTNEEIEARLALNPSRKTLWEFNIMHRNGVDGYRTIVAIGSTDPYIVRLSWFDVHVRLRVYGLLARWKSRKARRG